MVSVTTLAKGLKDPYAGFKHILRNGVVAGTSRFPVGTHVLNREWDVLIVLDTCRVDALRIVAEEYDFLGDVGKIWSLGGSSPEWIVHTFDRRWRRTLGETAYLNVNGWAERIIEGGPDQATHDIDNRDFTRLNRYGKWNVIDADELGLLEHVWKYVESGEDKWSEMLPDEYTHGRAPPRHLTDRAVSVARRRDFDRLILHYSQPHAPYVATAVAEDRELCDYEEGPFEYLSRTGDRETVFETYLDELRYVLDSVDLLLNNIDADEVIITADHGDAFGEYGVYGHSAGSVHPHVRYVPWARTTARDSGTYSPDLDPETSSDRSAEEALEALGYKM